MMRAALLVILSALPAHAAVIRGSVVENLTGKVLARAEVTLTPMEGTPGQTRTVRTSLLGSFEFDKLAAGAYVVKASRRGFLPAEAGQKRWNSAGQPVLLEESATTFLMLRLPRFSAITGAVVDDNEIGLPDHEVAVYRQTQPPQLIGQATTDDRGAYRVGGLEPGRYVVRTIGKQYEDGGYLPTFSRETPRLEEAQIVDVLLEQQAEHVDVRPLPGESSSLTVTVETDPPGLPVTLTLASAMGRRTIEGSFYQFTGLPPGEYEVYSEADTGLRTGEKIQGSYQRVTVKSSTAVTLLPQRGSPVTISGADSSKDGELWMRRKDLAGVGPVRAESIGQGRIILPAGRWEVLLRPPSGYYCPPFSRFCASGPTLGTEFSHRAMAAFD